MAIPTQPISNELTTRLLAWMLSKRRMEVEREQRSGRYVLAYCRPLRVVACSLNVLALALLVLSVAGTAGDPKALAICASVFGLLAGGAFWLLHDVYVVRISASAEGLFRRGLLGEERRVPWSAISEVRYSPAASWLRFRASGHPTMRVSLYRDGLASLGRLARQGLRDEVARRLPGELPGEPGQDDVPLAA